MRCSRWLVALLGACLVPSEGRAQGILINPYAVGGVSVGASFGSGHHRSPRFLSFYLPGSYGLIPSYAGPYGYSTTSQITVLYSPPPSLVLVPAPAPELPPEPKARALEAAPEPLPEPPLPGRPAGKFRPLEPDNRERALRPVPPEQAKPEEVQPPRPKPPEQPKPPPAPPKEEPKRRPPARPEPEADPRAESARLLALAREAFAAQEYGRAEGRLRQATILAPRDALAQFLLGQALFALGKYVEAVEAVQAGLALQPDWPMVAFQPLELYGPNVADYPEHLQRLEAALNRHPDDPVLLFLYAYELWFDGRKEEARPLFQRAAAHGADAKAVERFLRALPGEPAL